MKKTLVTWRRFGREHGEDRGFRVNTPEVIRKHLQAGVDRFSQTPEEDWRWYEISDELIVERPMIGIGQNSDTRIYYLPKRNWVILANASFPSLPDWPWYVHIGKIERDDALDAWVFTDHFADVIIRADGMTHSVLDLDDLASVAELGLIDPPTVTDILIDTQRLVDSIRLGKFPPVELADREAINDKLGWNT